MLRFDRKQQNSIKQLSFNKIRNKKKKRKVCFNSDARNWGEGGHLFKGQLPHLQPEEEELLWTEEGSYLQTKYSQALTVIFKLVIGGLTSIILVVLGTVNLQFQGCLVCISLRPVLITVAAYITATVWSSGNFFVW